MSSAAQPTLSPQERVMHLLDEARADLERAESRRHTPGAEAMALGSLMSAVRHILGALEVRP